MLLSRRSALKLALGSTALTLMGPIMAQASAPVLRVTHFGGPYSALENIVGARFEEAGLGVVEYEQDQPNLILAKWQAQPQEPAYDIGLLMRATSLRAQSTQLALPLTVETVPNLALALDGAVAEGGAGVAMAFDTIDIMYDANQVSEPITSWLDLWRPELAGKIMLPGMPIDDCISLLLVCVARASGLSEDRVAEILPKFVELKKNVHSFYSDPNQASQMLERGDIAVAVQYSARIGQLMKRYEHIKRATPVEGVPSIPYDLVIAANSAHPKVAADYINMAISPEVQAEACAQLLVNPSVKDVPLSDETLKYIIQDQSKLFAVNDKVLVEQQQSWLDTWVRDVQA